MSAFDQLSRHFTQEAQYWHLSDLFQRHPQRAAQYSLPAADLFVDFSKNLITDKTWTYLCDWAMEQRLPEALAQLTSGGFYSAPHERVVFPELRWSSLQRAILPLSVQQSWKEYDRLRDRIKSLNSQGEIRGVLHIGIGGSVLGPQLLWEVVAPEQRSIPIYFLSGFDPSAWENIHPQLDPKHTLVWVVSKSFQTTETLSHLQDVVQWFSKQLNQSESDIKEQRVFAVTDRTDRAVAHGIPENNLLKQWPEMTGRFSVWSLVSGSVECSVGSSVFQEFLQGAAEIDEYVRTTPWEKNAAVALGLIGAWYRQWFGWSDRAVMVYEQSLSLLIPYLQQLEMESNGKSIQRNGEPVACHTATVVWGGVGTDAQHSVHQYLHQGTQRTPVDFIVGYEPKKGSRAMHAQLFAHALAQSQALMGGHASEKPEAVLKGNRPSNLITYSRLTPKILGSLLALYEYRTFVQGVLWNINSFDQWGVEYGKQLAGAIHQELKDNNPQLGPWDGSTLQHIKRWKEHGGIL